MRSVFGRLAIVSAGAAALVAHAPLAVAQARICVEEAAGVCLKYAEVRKLSPAETAERDLGLTRADRLRVQANLAAAGDYPGPIDGAFGPQTRAAIRDWQTTRGEVASGFLTAPQATALTVQPSAPAEAEVGPEHPETGRVYRSGYVNALGATVTLEAERISGDEVRLTVGIDADRRFRQSCEAPATGPFTCYLRQAGWNMRILSGELPDAKLDIAEALPNLPPRSENERFTLW